MRGFRERAEDEGSAGGEEVPDRLGESREGYRFGVGFPAQGDEGERHHERGSLADSAENSPEKGKARSQEPPERCEEQRGACKETCANLVAANMHEAGDEKARCNT